MNYTELKQAIKDYTTFDEETFNTNIPIFIESAEKEAARLLRLPVSETHVELTLEDEDRTSSFIPADYVMLKEAWLSETFEPIVYTPLSDFMRKKAGITPLDGKRYFSRRLNEFIFYPSIPEEEMVHLVYFVDPTNMPQGGDSTVILNLAPDLMLYLCLKHAMIFMNNDQEANVYNQLAQNSIDGVRRVAKDADKPVARVVPKRKRNY